MEDVFTWQPCHSSPVLPPGLVVAGEGVAPAAGTLRAEGRGRAHLSTHSGQTWCSTAGPPDLPENKSVYELRI